MGEPHLERLTMSFREQGEVTDEQSVDFGIRGDHVGTYHDRKPAVFAVNGKPILIRGAGGRRICCCAPMSTACATSSVLSKI